MNRADLIGGLMIMGFSLLLIFWIIPTQTASGNYFGLSPVVFPIILSAGFGLCGLGLTLQALRRLKAEGFGKELPVSASNIFFFLLIIGLVLGSVILMDFFGLIYGAPVMIAGLMLILGERSWLTILLTSTVPVAVVYLVVTYVLRAPLP